VRRAPLPLPATALWNLALRSGSWQRRRGGATTAAAVAVRTSVQTSPSPSAPGDSRALVEGRSNGIRATRGRGRVALGVRGRAASEGGSDWPRDPGGRGAAWTRRAWVAGSSRGAAGTWCGARLTATANGTGRRAAGVLARSGGGRALVEGRSNGTRATRGRGRVALGVRGRSASEGGSDWPRDPGGRGAAWTRRAWVAGSSRGAAGTWCGARLTATANGTGRRAAGVLARSGGGRALVEGRSNGIRATRGRGRVALGVRGRAASEGGSDWPRDPGGRGAAWTRRAWVAGSSRGAAGTWCGARLTATANGTGRRAAGVLARSGGGRALVEGRSNGTRATRGRGRVARGLVVARRRRVARDRPRDPGGRGAAWTRRARWAGSCRGSAGFLVRRTADGNGERPRATCYGRPGSVRRRSLPGEGSLERHQGDARAWPDRSGRWWSLGVGEWLGIGRATPGPWRRLDETGSVGGFVSGFGRLLLRRTADGNGERPRATCYGRPGSVRRRSLPGEGALERHQGDARAWPGRSGLGGCSASESGSGPAARPRGPWRRLDETGSVGVSRVALVDRARVGQSDRVLELFRHTVHPVIQVGVRGRPN
jgi:hypothetical protein